MERHKEELTGHPACTTGYPETSADLRNPHSAALTVYPLLSAQDSEQRLPCSQEVGDMQKGPGRHPASSPGDSEI